MEARTDSASTFEHIPWWGMLIAIVPMMFLAIVSFINLFQLGGTAMPDWLGYILLAIFILPFLAGLLKGIPHWCLPYLGVFASLASIALSLNFSRGLYRLINMSDPWIFRQALQGGFPWVGLLLLTIFFVLITLVLPPFRPVYARIRDDWTLLSFGLYGAMVLGLMLTFEDYPPVGRGFYETFCSLFLGLGTWVYLRSPRVRQRALALFASITLAMAAATIGKALLIASPEWPFPRGHNDWQDEAISTAIDGAWMLVVVLLVPALVNFLPRPSHPKLAA